MYSYLRMYLYVSKREQSGRQYAYKAFDTNTKQEISMKITSKRFSRPYLGSRG